MKWTGIVVAVLLVVLLVAGVTLMQTGKAKERSTVAVTGLLSEIPSDSAAVARGAEISRTHVCRDCHGASFEGKVFVDAPPFRIVAPNLTSGQGGVASAYDEVADWDRSIRYGVRPNGTALLIMPSKAFHHLSDTDAAALIAYLQTIPPVDNELPPREIRPLGQVLLGAGAIDINMEVNTAPMRRPAPLRLATAEYGEYIVSTLCSYCHGQDLNGGPALDPEMPPPPTLAAASTWTLADFTAALRTGVAPGGRQLNQEMMPASAFSHFTDDDIQALHLYLKEHFSGAL